MKTLLTLFVFCLTAHAQIFGPPTRFREVYHSPGAGQSAFPSGVSAGYTVTVIDGDSANPCTTGGGSTKSQCRYSGSAWQAVGPASSGGGSGDASTNTSSSVDGEAAVFSGTGGKTLKRATSSGIAKLASGVLGAVTITAGAGISVTNGDGASGNPTIATDTAVHPTANSMQNGVPFYSVTATSTTAYTCALTPTANSSILTTGAQVRVRIHATNTAAGPTISCDGQTAKPIWKRNGNAASTVVAIGDLLINQTYTLTYNSSLSSGVWETDIGTPAALTYRTCSITIGADNGSALTDADLGPQGRICFIPQASTITEVTVASDAGTPSVQIRKNVAGTTTNLLSAALAAVGGGGASTIACAKSSTSATCLDGTTSSGSITVSTTSLAQGSWIELASGTAGGTAKRMSVAVTYTIN